MTEARNDGGFTIGRTHNNDWMPDKPSEPKVESKLLAEKELRETIACAICGNSSMCKDHTPTHNRGNVLVNFCPVALQAADRAMLLIKQSCWLKGEQELPHIYRDELANTLVARNTYFEAQFDMLEAGWKPCKEWEHD